MADIQDLSLGHVKKFLSINGLFLPKDKNMIYDKVFKLMNEKHTLYDDVDISIIQWMLAYNALKRKTINKIYRVNDINNMSELELYNLAKSLGMQGNNIINIVHILRFMHMYNTKLEQETITGIYDLDKILLQTIDSEELNNLALNDYTRKILNDQNFWKERLQKRLGLTTNKNIDYKFITKFLDNGKSFEENYQSALKKKFFDIVDILVENNVVMVDKPLTLLENISITIDDLGEIKYYSYDDFIRYIFDKTNDILIESDEDPIDISYFDEKIYTGDAIIIEIVNPFYDPFDEKPEEFKTFVFRSKNGFTNGEILYELAQKIPNDDEIKENNIDFVRKHPNNILNDIKKLFPYLEDRKKRGDNGADEEFNYLKKDYNIIILSELLKDPIKFLKYNKEHPNSYVTDYISTDVWGGHIFWEGLSYYDGKYLVNLG
jgi:hypothetical protein